MMAAVLLIAAAYRLPGVSWGVDIIDAPEYEHPHPDEGIACLDAMERGVAELMNASNPAERGMMFQCVLLRTIFGAQSGIIPRARLSRTYTVFWGLASILLTALIARRLKGDAAGLFAALLLTTSGIHLITSFWLRGQVQNVTFFLASILVALRVRRSKEKEKAAVLLFVAAALGGAALATRWSFALVPMLLGCAVARGPIAVRLAATVAGALFGFFGSTGFFWTPELVRMNFEYQAHNLVMLYSRVTPFTTGAAAIVCILAGTGLVTFVFALWYCVDRARRLRRVRRRRFAWPELRSVLDSPRAIIGVPFAITFVLLCFNKAFDARYTDLFAPACAILAGVRMAELWERLARRWIVFAVLFAYQGVYATGMLARYTHDARNGMNAALAEVWRPRAKTFVGPYVSDSKLYRGFSVAPNEGPWDAEWFVFSDVYAGQYLTRSGTFPFLGAPPSCREILYCDGEQFRAFVQKVFARDGWDEVYVAKAAAWTPEVKLHHALMTSKWMFTGNIRLFHRRPSP
jgi:hypothetical protein